MRVTTLITWSMTTGEVLEHDHHEYSGTWELCKGEQAQANKIAASQLKLQQDAFNLQQQQIGAVNSVAAPYVTPQGQGYTPEQMALLNSTSANNLNSAYNSATGNVRSYLAGRGEGTGALPPGGAFVPGFASLEAARSSDLANAYRTNQLSNIQQALSNKFNAASLMAGLAPIYSNNVGTFGNQALSALGTANNAGQNSFLGTLGKTAGTQLGLSGAALGVGSLGGLMSSWLSKPAVTGLPTADPATIAASLGGIGSLLGSGGSGWADPSSGMGSFASGGWSGLF